MTYINPLDDVMSYFHLVALAYMVLTIVVGGNVYKAFHINRIVKENKSNTKIIQIVDLIIGGLCLVAMASGIVFMGVLADNNALGLDKWGIVLFTVSAISLVLYIINVILVYKDLK